VNFDYSEEQRLLADSVRRFVEKDYSFEARKRIVDSAQGWSEPVWKSMADIGLLGLALPVEHGGFGGRAVDLMSTMEAIGEALVVEPYLSTLVGAMFVARAGSEAQKSRMLPVLAEGRLRMAFAHTEADSRYDLGRVSVAARREGDAWRVDGEKHVVLHAPAAHGIVVSARTPRGISLLLVDRESPGTRLTAYRTLDGLRAADIAFQDAAGELLGEEGAALPIMEEVVDYATALLCAEAVGAIRYANAATLEYLKTRQQFGVPIGSFQALQHRMVDMVISYEQARSMASLACARVDAGLGAAERQRIVSAAKVRIADACRHVSQESVQLHGGMGMTEELKVSHTFRRLTMIAQQFGDADHHLERFAALPA
jgi:alkylation response protein AidB-like acyl-CoA dehydrogenase